MKNNPNKALNEEIQRIKSLFYENFNKKEFNLKGDVLNKDGLHINLEDDSNIGSVGLINFGDAFGLDYDVIRFYNGKEQYCKSGCEENFFNKDNSIYLYSLFVDSSHRGKGFGKEIVEKCHEIARDLGYKYVLLITNCDNDVAQNLYKGLGYEIHQTDGNKDFYFVEV
jgi:ribosomal protein S18 acetylase RimI-like enzyme